MASLNLNFRLSFELAPQLTLEEMASETTPDRFVCPVLQDGEPMIDPIRTSCGHVFERKVINELFSRAVAKREQNISCPLCRRKLSVEDVSKYFRLTQVIREWMSSRIPDPLQQAWDVAFDLHITDKINFTTFVIIDSLMHRGHELIRKVADNPAKIAEIHQGITKIMEAVEGLDIKLPRDESSHPEMVSMLATIESDLDRFLTQRLFATNARPLDVRVKMIFVLLKKQFHRMSEEGGSEVSFVERVTNIAIPIVDIMEALEELEEKFA